MNISESILYHFANIREFLVIHLLIGRLNEKVAPFLSELFSAHIFPPCASIIAFETNSPIPIPSLEDLEVVLVVVTNLRIAVEIFHDLFLCLYPSH